MRYPKRPSCVPTKPPKAARSTHPKPTSFKWPGHWPTPNCPANIASMLEQNPQQAVEGLVIAQAIEDITGEYQSPHNMYSFKVGLSNNVLMADAVYDDGNLTFPLLSDDIANLVFKGYSLVADNKSKIEFLRNEKTGKVEYVTYDRYLYRRQ